MFTDQQPTTVDKQTLAEIVGFVWEMFMSERIEECDHSADDAGMTATISIGGPWTATLAVTVSEGLAAQFSGALLGVDPNSLDAADVEDALGELANVVGGNVKGLLDDNGASTLSLPVVSHDVPTVAGGQLTVSCYFDVHGDVMTWALYERP